MIRSICFNATPIQEEKRVEQFKLKEVLTKRWASIVVVGFVVLLATARISNAQTLNEQLIAEDSNKLVEEALSYGDPVRGAILFHQGNINCAKCHRAAGAAKPIGPDLSRIEPGTKNESIVESILQPSKVIKKGYETALVLTLGGKTISGTIVSENDKQVVIRDIENVENLITIKRDDVDEVQPGKLSSMPAELANQLKNRKQFLDLLRYVLDLKKRGPEEAAPEIATVGRKLSPELAGLVEIQKFNCTGCHQSDSLQLPVAAKQAPRLAWSAKWLNPEYLSRFVADPHEVKPGTTMPRVIDHSNEAMAKKSAAMLVNFLASKAGNQYRSEPIDDAAVPRGFELFNSVGCVACHAPRDQAAVEQPLDDSTPLGDLANKYNVTGLTSLLEDPLAVRPSGHMPNMTLTHREAVDISTFLLQSSASADSNWKPDAQLAAGGKFLFQRMNCAACHQEFTENQVQLSKIPFEKVDPQKGCLSQESGSWPDFQLSPLQRESIVATLANIPKPNDQQKIDVTLTSFNCTQCHSRADLGGVSIERNPHFKTTDLNLGDQGRIPPTLSGVGRKLKSKWVRDVLVNARKIRPYMKTRMPQFGEENIGHLVKLFESTAEIPAMDPVEFEDQKKMRTEGMKLAGNKGLNCVACHTYQYKKADTMPAVDLTEMTERLKKEWFHRYMLNPQKFSPDTVMPSFWPGGKAIRSDIKGSPEENIEALWQYLIDGRQARQPSGVVREPLEIVVKGEAQMLRRSYPGIGKRGIGVGYPGGVNIAFDAEQMRLASIWKGKFVEASGVWRGQGSGIVKPMGKTIEFAKGPELDSKTDPWVVDEGRPPNHQFKGYSLDKSQRPTFRYKFGAIEVEDFFSQSESQSPKEVGLQRSVLLTAGAQSDKLRFRIAQNSEIAEGKDGAFLIGDRLEIRIVSDQKVEIVDAEEEKRLEVWLSFAAGKQEKLKIEYWFK